MEDDPGCIKMFCERLDGRKITTRLCCRIRTPAKLNIGGVPDTGLGSGVRSLGVMTGP